MMKIPYKKILLTLLAAVLCGVSFWLGQEWVYYLQAVERAKRAVPQQLKTIIQDGQQTVTSSET